MELVTKKKLLLVAGRVHPELATEISERLGVPLGDVELASFPNGERHCRYGESIRGADLFIPVSYTHLRAHETVLDLVCRLLLENKKQTNASSSRR